MNEKSKRAAIVSSKLRGSSAS